MNRNEIAKIARMARIRITEDEMDKYTDINNILKLYEQINEINTKNIEPMAHPLEILQRLRNDEITEKNERDYLQAIASGHIEEGLYLVPEVIEEK